MNSKCSFTKTDNKEALTLMNNNISICYEGPLSPVNNHSFELTLILECKETIISVDSSDSFIKLESSLASYIKNKAYLLSLKGTGEMIKKCKVVKI